MSIASSVQSQITPAVTCAPWKPVRVKKEEPKRLVRIVSPSCTNDVNSYAWKSRKVVPKSAVMNSQSFDEPMIPPPPRARYSSRFTTALCASTMNSDDISRQNVDAEVTGMFRIGRNSSAGAHPAIGPSEVTLVARHQNSCG